MMGQPMMGKQMMGDGTGSLEEMAARMKALAGNMQQGMPAEGMPVGGNGLSMMPPPGTPPGTPGPYVNTDPDNKFRQTAPPPPPPVNPGIPPAGTSPKPGADPYAEMEKERAKREFEMRTYGRLQGGK